MANYYTISDAGGNPVVLFNFSYAAPVYSGWDYRSMLATVESAVKKYLGFSPGELTLSGSGGVYLKGDGWCAGEIPDAPGSINYYIQFGDASAGNVFNVYCAANGWDYSAEGTLFSVTPKNQTLGTYGTIPVYDYAINANTHSNADSDVFGNYCCCVNGTKGNVFELDVSKDVHSDAWAMPKYSENGSTWSDTPPSWARVIKGRFDFNTFRFCFTPNFTGVARTLCVYFPNASLNGVTKSGTSFGARFTQAGTDDSLAHAGTAELRGAALGYWNRWLGYANGIPIPRSSPTVSFKVFIPAACLKNPDLSVDEVATQLKALYESVYGWYVDADGKQVAADAAVAASVSAESGRIFSVSIDFGATIDAKRRFTCASSAAFPVARELFADRNVELPALPNDFQETDVATGVRFNGSSGSVSMPIKKNGSSPNGECFLRFFKAFPGNYTIAQTSGLSWLEIGEPKDYNAVNEAIEVSDSSLYEAEDYSETRVALKFSANTGARRTATLKIVNAAYPDAPVTFTIEQEGEPFGIDPAQGHVPAEGGTAAATVSAGDLSALTVSASDGVEGGDARVSVDAALDASTGALSVRLGAIPLTSRNYELTVITVSDADGNAVTLSVEQTVAVYVLAAAGGAVLNVASGGESRARVNLAPGESSRTLTVQAAEDGDFSAETSASWLSAAFADGAATATGLAVGDTRGLTLTAEANTGGEARTATVTLRCTASSVPVYVDVTQHAALSVEPAEVSFTAYGGTAKVAFTAATEADAPTRAIPTAAWLSAQPDGTLTAEAWTSTEEVSRSASATFIAESGARASVEVVQKGVFKIAASPALLRLPLRGGSASVALTLSARAAAVGVGELKRSAEWFSVSVVGATATISAEANATGATRSGTFYWLNAAEGHSDVVSVVQPGGVAASPSSVEFASVGGSASVEVESAAGAFAERAETSAAWLSAQPDGTLTAEAHAGKSPREATATFFADGASASVAVRQLAPRRVPAMFFRGVRVVG